MIIFLILIGIIVFWGFTTYNKFIRQIQAVINSEKEISIQLDRRGKVFDSLVNTVKKYMEHEKGTLSEIVALRSKIKESNIPSEIRNSEDKLSKMVSQGDVQHSINIAVEAYPELKSDKNMAQLQETIVSTENKLSFAKKAFNNNIEVYNTTKESVPSNFLPKIFNNLNKEFIYWSLTEEENKVEEAKELNFNINYKYR